jgi:formylglycine-generating enzyme required for sulfatase activity
MSVGSLLQLLVLVTSPFGPTDDLLHLSTSSDGRVRIPAGSFVMGASLDELRVAARMCLDEGLGADCIPTSFQDEAPSRVVRVGAYRIDRTEVTNDEFGRCVRAGACAPPHILPQDARFRRLDGPVVGVAWQDARDYCAWAGGRLPTEAEWERAARGADERRFPWGQYWNPHLANHLQTGELRSREYDGHRTLAPVGSYPGARSPFGLDDMAGNVLEWVQDYYGEYVASQLYGPTGPPEGMERVTRGGSWRTPGVFTRTTARLRRNESTRDSDLGFRCAESVRP